MPSEAPQRATFSVCQTCGGSGRTGPLAVCRDCRGVGRFALGEHQMLYWDFGLDALHVMLRRWNQMAQNALNASLIILLLLNLLNVYRIGASVAFDPALFFNRVFISGHRIAGPFWVMLIFNLYLLYRLFRHEASAKRPNLPVARQSEKRLNIANVLQPSVVALLDTAWPYARKNGQLPIRTLQLFGIMFEHKDILMILSRLGLPEERLLDTLRRQIAYYPPIATDDGLSDEVKDIMLNAYHIAVSERSSRVRVTDVFLATVQADEKIQELLYEHNVDLVKVTNVIKWINFNNILAERFRRYRSRAVFKPKGPINRSYTAAATPYLDSFSTDITQLARAGRLPLTVARDREIEELFREMEGGKSVLLVGEKGVGKGNLIEGLANRMVAEDVPTLFQDKRLVGLSLPFLVAGASKTGEVQERLLLVLQEVRRSGNIIIVIEEIDNIVGVSSAGTENIDLSEVLSQELQNSSMRVIATTTPQNMKEFVERSALMGVFERVQIPEPDRNQSIQIVQANVAAVEAKYKVFFTYESLEKIVDLSDRYLHDQFLPAKAINLLVEAGSWIAKRDLKLIVGEDIAALVSRKTNIPLTQVTKKETDVLLNLSEIMHGRIIGQDEAVKLVVSALRRARTELRDQKRPIVNMLFLGPTGVGKTELAKTIAASYFGSEEAMIRLDMSEYQAQDSIARLLGAPGGKTGGMLTDAVRQRPFALVLLDEVEKAHPDILNIFLQVMDDGRLTDTLGRTVDFTNVILVATSNAGSTYIQDEVSKLTPIEVIKDELIRHKLRDSFRPEFLNRFDGIVVFKPLSREEIFEVAGLMLKSVAKRLADKGISLVVTPGAQRELAQAGFDPIFGARPLRRVIQERVDDALANYLLQGKIGRRDEVVLDVGGAITVRKAEQL